MYRCDTAAEEHFTGLLTDTAPLTRDTFEDLKLKEEKTGGELFNSGVFPVYSTLTAVSAVLVMDKEKLRV